ncbi:MULTISPECIES: trehalase family glycosidase [unclassified Rhizobium]|uniref:MGH1-like glycoside hydrolase domain-containing protein n=1 Tax=unclassified Rhizobium TaxID=2613769 RepID=UPI0016230ED0|nr:MULTISPECIES: trehalase family glycosidase [unclassified Rhizobium]MBB3289633.1 putative isomerase [Rhizobium sp. BK252]MBB3404576.1 putative isomerase [Rhizobium sp. BK289]MBB3417052.1 putative isomerase [Rhizobium sp. BK284]MBB3484929.1 putative isomerase [Rhizobium sp. BK347]
MPQHTTIPLNRAWNTWSDRPAEMVFLPLGVRLTPVLYSSRSRTTSAIEPRHDTVRLGRHELDGSEVSLETEHTGTTLSFHWSKPDPFVVTGGWRAQASAEWGLRFWVTLAISADGATVTYDAAAGAALIKIGQRFVAVVSAESPVQVTGHDSIADLRQDFEANGYFYLASRSNAAPVIGLRFNLEMMRDGSYAAAVADRADLAIEKARAALARKAAPAADQTDSFLAAVRDIVGWNTIWDETNNRPYTAVTRIWNLGKFAVWYNDQTYAALLSGLFDMDIARENLAAAFAGVTPQGNVACIVTSNDAWVDRTQPPLGSLVLWDLYQRSGERSIVEASYDVVARAHRWWWDNRDPDRRGMISCGTSDVGESLYKGTAFGARNETGMDNSATHDEAVYDPNTRSLSTFDLGLNCVVALDAEMLAKLAAVLGKTVEVEEFEAIAAGLRRRISEELWDDKRRIFANRQRSGAFVKSLSPTSFYPLLCGAASDEQARHLMVHLQDDSLFAGEFGLPNATRNDPAYAENVYWRGRIWPNVNYLVWLGLKRYGLEPQAQRLRAQSQELFLKSWEGKRIAAENYNSQTGEAMDQGDTDPFYIWAGLLPLMAMSDVVDVDPWDGWAISNRQRDANLGTIVSPAGPMSVRIADGRLLLSINGKLFLETSLPLRLSGLSIAPGHVRMTISPVDPGGVLIFPALDADDVMGIYLDRIAIPSERVDGPLTIAIAASSEARKLEIFVGADTSRI